MRQGQVQIRVARALAAAAMAAVLLVAAFGLVFAAVVEPLLAVVVFPGLAYAFLCFRRPVWALCLLLFCQLYDQLLILVPASSAQSMSFMNTLTVPKMMFGVLVLTLLARTLLIKQEAPLRALRAQALYLLLCVMFLISCLPGSLNTGINAMTILVLSRLFNSIGLVILVIALVDRARTFYLVCVFLLLGNLGVAGIGIYEVATETYILDLRGVPVQETFLMTVEAGQFRVMGPSGDPSYYSVQMLLGIATALVVLLGSRSRWVRLACMGCIALFGLCIIPTASKGGILSCVILGGVYFLTARMRHKALWITAVAAAGLGAFLAYAALVDPTALIRLSGHGGSSRTTRYRIGFMEQAYHMIEQHPLVGIGAGQFSIQQPHYFSAAAPRRPQLPSNVFLQIAAETGLISLAIYLGILFLCCQHACRRIIRAREVRERNTAAALLAGIAGLVFFAATANLREYEYVWVLFTLTLLCHLVGSTPAGRNVLSQEIPPS